MNTWVSQPPDRLEDARGFNDDDDEAIVLSSEDLVVQSGEDGMVVEDNIIPSNNHMIPSEEHMTPPDGLLILSEDQMIPSEGHSLPAADHSSMISSETQSAIPAHIDDGINTSDDPYHINAADSDTAGEGRDTPLDSMTTDGYTDHLDPIDFIETHPRDFGCGSSALDRVHLVGHGRGLNITGGGVVHEVQYDRWGMIVNVEDNKKGKN